MKNEQATPVVNAAIVAYNRPQSLIRLIESLRRQSYALSRIVVVDNSTGTAVRDAIAQTPLAVDYHKMERNVGSAGGFHHAIKLAHADADYVWVFDDDMDIRDDAVEELVRRIPELNEDSRLGALRSGFAGAQETEPTEVDGFAWRGTLIKSSVITEVGFPDADFFLYAEDVDYSLRILNAGYRVYFVPSSIMWINSAPTKHTIRLLGRDVEFHHSPFRLYYSVRSELLLHVKHRNLGGLAKAIAYDAKITLALLTQSGLERTPYVKAITLGLLHGLLGIKGRCARYTDERRPEARPA